jgi:hypothetical protein
MPLSARRLAGVIVASVAIAIASPSAALAAAPSNDDFADATVISSLPFSDTVDNSDATTEADEPGAICFLPSQTVWYSFTPTVNTTIQADLAESSVTDSFFNVWRSAGPGFGGLSFLECAGPGMSATFTAQAGTTYYVQAWRLSGGGTLTLNVRQIPPPPNDDFVNATVITELPFNDTIPPSATVEPGEPLPSCGSGFPKPDVWYVFTPDVSGSFSASSPNGEPFAVYTGGSLSTLSEVSCRIFGVLTFHASAGTTYYYQSQTRTDPGGFSSTFALDVAPAPLPNILFGPSDPSIFDTVQFFDGSSDPGDVGFESRTWDFGDGVTGTDCCPTHRYAADGDYTVRLTVTTFDGRTASTSQVVHVETHDVAITKFTVPKAASAGQTRQITVGVNSKHYPETVRVQLLKRGFGEIGFLEQLVPVQGGNRTTAFSFTYTFTSDDAAIGKVTFEARVIFSGRDALPADNEAIASPTKVSP